jgi:two-component system, NtrC family, nitrogen regulation response regulator GlnG
MRRLAALTRDAVITPALIEQQLRVGGQQAGAAVPDDAGLGEAIEQHLARHFASYGGALPPDGLYDRVLADIERPLLRLTLAAVRGNQLKAARLLGINRNTLRKKLTDLGVGPSVRRSE